MKKPDYSFECTSVKEMTSFQTWVNVFLVQRIHLPILLREKLISGVNVCVLWLRERYM